jgi:autotransporter translocation and assembly factor TamB
MDSSMGSVGASLSTATVDLEVTSPGLEIGMKDGDLSLVGDVEMDRGGLDFFGSSFDIGGGKLSFTGKNYADPVMEIQAVRHTGRYGDVAANIAGTASKFDVEFQSADYPDQTDILSILLFGKPASELGDSEGQSGGSQLSAALAMAAGSQVNRALGSTLGGKIEFDQGAVKAGVPVGDKLFLSIERHSNVEEDENVLAVALEWLITRQMYAEVVTGDAGQSSGDLYMRWRF